MYKFKDRVKAAGTSLALAAGLAGGGAMLSTQASAQQDPNMGNALVFPYYTVRDGWQTLVNITNVTDNATVVKVRLHEAQNSRDVLDFYVLLSPKDVWSAWVSNDGNGRARLQTSDRSCTVPISVRDSGASTSEVAYGGVFLDSGSQEVSRMSEGYIEMLVVAELDPTATASGAFALGAAPFAAGTVGAPYYTIHVAGEPRDCTVAQNMFVATSADWDGINVPGTGNPAAALGNGVYQYDPVTSNAILKGNVSYINSTTGYAAGSEAIAVPAWGVGVVTRIPAAGPGAPNTNVAHLLTAQAFPWFLEPTLGSGSAAAGGVWTANYGTVEAFLNSSVVTNEWSNNAANGAQSDWVMTFPTKGGHVDYRSDPLAPGAVGAVQVASHIQAGCNQWRNNGVAVSTLTGGNPDNCGAGAAPGLAPFENPFGMTGVSNTTVQYVMYDREEGTATAVANGVTVSPAPPPNVVIQNLPYEANVLAVGNNDMGTVSSIFGSAISLTVDTTILASNASAGFLEVSFPNAGGNILPVTGFVLKSRDFGAPGLNYAQVMKHSYTP